MKIIVIKPIDTGKYEDMTDLFCKGLEKYCGHEIVKAPLISEKGEIQKWQKDFNINDLKNSDLIWAPFEPLIPVALALKEHLHIPVVGHFEIMPPTRFSLDEINESFFRNITVSHDRRGYHLLYKQYMDAYLKCDICTYLGNYERYNMERLHGNKIDKELYNEPYTINDELFKELQLDSTTKNQVVSIFRLVSNKRCHHVIKAFSLLKNPPKYIIIGDGPDKMSLITYAKELGVDIEFKGIISDEEKAKIINESLFSVHPWACLPVGECAYFNKVSICYFDPLLHKRLKDMVIFVENNNIQKLADKMQELIDDKDKCIEYGIKANAELMNNRTDIFTVEEASKRLNDIFKKVKK